MPSTHWVLLAVLVAFVTALSLPIYPYQWHLMLHVTGAILFIGNIVVTTAWMLLAERSGDRAVLSFASNGVLLADALFTAPGVLLILLNGLALAGKLYGWADFHQTSWILASLILLTLSGVVWAGFLLRYQFQMVRISRDAVSADVPLPADYFSVLRRWYVGGTVATLLPIVSLLLMIYKPALW